MLPENRRAKSEMDDSALALLERIGESHRRMVALTDALDWDGLVGEWRSIHPEIARLQKMALDRLSARERVQAEKRIAELLAFEEQISARITPWMEQVQPLLKTFRKFPLKGDGA